MDNEGCHRRRRTLLVFFVGWAISARLFVAVSKTVFCVCQKTNNSCGCGSAVTPTANSRGSCFESSHEQNLYLTVYCIDTTKIKKKRLRLAQFFGRKTKPQIFFKFRGRRHLTYSPEKNYFSIKNSFVPDLPRSTYLPW